MWLRDFRASLVCVIMAISEYLLSSNVLCNTYNSIVEVCSIVVQIISGHPYPLRKKWQLTHYHFARNESHGSIVSISITQPWKHFTYINACNHKHCNLLFYVNYFRYTYCHKQFPEEQKIIIGLKPIKAEFTCPLTRP